MPALTRGLASNPPAVPDGKAKLRLFDDKLIGFFMEIRVSGKVTYYCRYNDARGRQREVRIGRHGDVTLDQARKRAQEIKAAAALGGDPAADRDRLRAVPTFGEFVEGRYLPHIKGKLRSYRDQESFYRLRLKALWGARYLDQIRPGDVAEFQERLNREGLAGASINRYTAFIKRVFNVALHWEAYEGRNPAQRAEMRREQGRERFLTDGELVALFKALDVEPSRTAACAIAMLAATGARRGEVLGARWDRVDIERRILTVPAASSKSGRARYIPLSDAALRILQRVPRSDSPWVFPSIIDPEKPVGDLRKTWARVKERAGIGGSLCLHQLRHTYASRLVGQGRSLYEVGQLLGHASVTMTARYSHLAPQRLVEAANLALPDSC
jgi:integrase